MDHRGSIAALGLPLGHFVTTVGRMSSDELPDDVWLPPETRDFCRVIAAEAVEAPAALRAQVDAYDARIDFVAGDDGFVDVGTAKALVVGCRALLDRMDEGDPRHRRLVHLAVRYFVLEDDGESDLGSVTGFDDDAEVFDAIVDALGFPELAIGH